MYKIEVTMWFIMCTVVSFCDMEQEDYDSTCETQQGIKQIMKNYNKDASLIIM